MIDLDSLGIVVSQVALAVTLLWMFHRGQWVVRSGHRTRLEAASKRDYSLFRLDRDWVRRVLMMGFDTRRLDHHSRHS